jgi:hypothetical protein
MNSDKDTPGERLARIETKLDSALSWLKNHEERLKDNEADINKAKGGWFSMVTVGGVAGAVVGWVIDLVRK